MAEMRDRMRRGEPYIATADPDIAADMQRAQQRAGRFNAAAAGTDASEHREALLRELVGSLGADVEVRPNLRCDLGYQIAIGDRSFLNCDCVLLDIAPITIGADCRLGPCVQLLTPTHPIDPVRRREAWESGEPIILGADVWLGGGVIVCPGVQIGAGTVVGAGAVVTRDLPPGVVAVGNPARVLRAIGDEDRDER